MCTPQNKEALTGQNTTGHRGGSCSSHKSLPPLWLHLLSGICIDTRLLGSLGTKEASQGAFYPCFHLKASWFSNLFFFSFEAMSPTIAQLPLNLKAILLPQPLQFWDCRCEPPDSGWFSNIKTNLQSSQLLESKKPQEGRMGRKLRIPTPSRTSHSLTGKSFFHFLEHYVINTWVANAPQ